MPICTRPGFDLPISNKSETFQDNEEVFFCEVTKEIFREYEDYFRHVIVINSTVWQCEATGRDNLTYAEALKSERRARLKMEQFKDSLRPAVMLIIDQAKQSSLNTLTSIIFKFLRKRYFLKEEISACATSSKYNSYVVVDIIPPDEPANEDHAYNNTESIQYKLQRIGHTKGEVVVPYENIRRQRSEFTTENLHMFIKSNCIRIDGILRPKPESFKRYVTDRNIKFSTIFVGKMPHFEPAKIRRLNNENGKKQATINKYLVKTDEERISKASPQEQAKRAKEKMERDKAKAKSLKEEMERVKQEKQEKLAALERQRLEKKAKLMEKIEAECTALLTKTDDLDRTDQLPLPAFKPIRTLIPIGLMGDAFMVREFMQSFGTEVFRGSLSFAEMMRAFSVREVAGPLSDILITFLAAIFNLQKEEEEECTVDYLKLRTEMRRKEPFISMSEASRTHFFTKRHFYYKINELPIDHLTLSEVLRLHMLSSGAMVKERAEKWRIMYRNGYSSVEDPGFQLRMQYPHILRALKMYTIYQLPFIDIMRVVKCLMAQILTYSSCINVIEERMEQMSASRMSLRTLIITENRRLAAVQSQKRGLSIEYHQQCMNDQIKNDQEKKKALEDKLNKQLNEITVQSEREHRKFEQQVEKFNSALFNFLVYLGMDRAYRKYYVLESMPGIFVEHPIECMDTCLSDPPQNNLTEMRTNAANLPKNRKDLRAFLLKKYTDAEKKMNIDTKTKTDAQENKENHEIQNSEEYTNGHDAEAASNGIKSEEQDADIKPDFTTLNQYQLYMCTGDRHKCIVHDERNVDRQRWAFLHEKEDIDALIESLNPLGERESHLREQLITLRILIVNHVKKCPVEMLTIDPKQLQKYRNIIQTETNRKYNKSNLGFSEGSDLNEVTYAALVERILVFERDIYTGDLGRLKVKNMDKWREDVQNDTYDAQGKLQWGPTGQKLGATTNAPGEEEDLEDIDYDDMEVDINDGGQYANTPFKDPGDVLGDTMEIDSEDSSEDEISLHDSHTLRLRVRNLASALLQVEQAIERRFMKEPFGVQMKEVKDKEVLERKLKWGVERLKQWEVSLMESTSYAQVFLHLNVLHDSVVWARSTNKSLCQVCRRGSDPDKMLLCDECNGGTHMFCMKPKMKEVPEGNWYCNRCVNRLGLRNDNGNAKHQSQEARKRKFLMDEEQEVTDNSSLSSESMTRSSGRRRDNRPLQPNEIEEAIEESEQEEEAEEEAEGGAEDEDDIEEEVETDGSADEADQIENGDNASSSEEEDENVCAICSYDGGDLLCIRCRDTFHLECINLKRPPRYNFICARCKSNNEKKRRHKTADSTDEDEDAETSEPSVKKQRQSRSSLRNGSNSNSTTSTNSTPTLTSSQRRSNRRTGEHLPLNSSALYKLLEDVMKHKMAWPFLRPVLQSQVPDYYKIIKNPMDLAKIKSKLNMGEYQLNEEVMNDMQLIFLNCDHYNINGNEIYRAGSDLEKFVMERCKDLRLPFKPSDMNK